MNIDIKPCTLITLIGVSGSGKTFFANKAKDHIQSLGKKCVIVSSSDIRNELRCDDSSVEPYELSLYGDVAYKLLMAKIESFMQSPVNIDVIIVDSTATNYEYRKELTSLAKKYTYDNHAIIFNPNATMISNMSDYDESFFAKRVNNFRTKVLPKFNRHEYNTVTRVDKFVDFNLNYIDETKVYIHDTSTSNIGIIGDIHCQYEQLIELVNKSDLPIYLLNGDYIDKDSEDALFKTLDYINTNVYNGKFKLIRGNHETYVYNALMSNKKYELNDETKHFMSLFYLKNNEYYKEMFINLYENHTYDYAIINTPHKRVYVSHAPCKLQHIGKHSQKSLKNMRNMRILHDTSIIEQMKDIINEKLPFYHIFGHVEVSKDTRIKNGHIAIDQGCVSGGYLTCCIVNSNGNIDFVDVKSDKPKLKNIPYLYEKEVEKLVDLNTYQQRSLDKLMQHKPLFLSGTVAPAPYESNDFEGVSAAIKYFKNKGINEVITQRKHMGSRAQIYLYKNLEDCYAVSRNGYKIKHSIVKDAIEVIYNKYKGKYDSLLILDSELMPWKAMAEGMINKQFYSYYTSGVYVNDMLKNSKLATMLDIDTISDRKDLELFKTQVDIYAKDDDIHFNVFDVIYKDSVSLLCEDKSKYLYEYDIPYTYFNLDDEEDVDNLIHTYELSITNPSVEGIVIKPNVWQSDIIPMMKVRNKEYLRIIYGHDYLNYVNTTLNKKSVGGKINASIREHNLNIELMNVENDDDLKHIYHKFIVEFEKEKTIDPRL